VTCARALALLGVVAACAPAASPRAPSPATLPARRAISSAAAAKPARIADACTYRVSVSSESPLVASVHARCEAAGITGFAPADAAVSGFVRLPDAPGARPPFPASRRAAGVAELTYEVNLDALARDADDIDTARRFGRSLLAPASSFLLAPDPPVDGLPVHVFFDAPGVETGLRVDAAGGGYVVESHELKVATYTAFGVREARDIAVGDGAVRLALLDGTLDLPLDELARWVADAAAGVATFFGRAPEKHTLVVLAPVPGRHGIPFGKVLPESAPGVVVLVGEHTKRAELHDDWVLVHELFHVGTPSYLGEGKWYDEGLATYFEPLIRLRLGWRSEADLWDEFLRDMPRGLDAMTRRGLANPQSYSDVYWGGAMFCLLADVAVRRASGGTRGLEDGVRAVFDAGGVASEVWSLAQATALTDQALGAPVLADLERAHLDAGSPLDLRGLFRELGVSRDKQGRIVLDEAAPLAAVRRALAYGAPR
jgi:hypothetical protein